MNEYTLKERQTQLVKRCEVTLHAMKGDHNNNMI